MNGSAQKTASIQRENTPNVAPSVPLSPPRYIATTVNNNNISVASKEHTEEQLSNIKKYQVQCVHYDISQSVVMVFDYLVGLVRVVPP